MTNLAGGLPGGGAVIRFDYEVVRGDRDLDGISIGANAIEMNGGGFRDSEGHLIAPTLAHAAVAADRRPQGRWRSGPRRPARPGPQPASRSRSRGRPSASTGGRRRRTRRASP